MSEKTFLEAFNLIGAHGPFLVSLSDGPDNELQIVIADSSIGEKVNPQDIDDEILQPLFVNTRYIDPDYDNSYKIVFENYIIYQMRNESYSCFENEGKPIVVFEKSELLDYLPLATGACKLNDGSYYPDKWKHYGIYTQNHVIDVISHCAPIVSQCKICD